jgi:23S rRNA pseudouridine1911/1915/1917 synthase
MQSIIDERHDGALLRTYLTGHLGLSRRLLTRLKARPDGILLGGIPVTVRAILHAGDVLTLATEDDEATPRGHIVPSATLPDVLYEDDDILVCNKPALMPTHPSHGHFDDTLANAVARYALDNTGEIGVFRPVNRLDRNTSGIVLIAKHQVAAAKLSQAMQQGLIQKQYLALLEGTLLERQGTIRASIRRAQESIITREICPPDAPGAKEAVTHYRVIACYHLPGGLVRTLVSARPITGRTHQLRLHFAHMGAPIVGDDMYGLPSPLKTPDHHILHAYALTFPHPQTGRMMTLVAPLGGAARDLLPDPTTSHSYLDSTEDI